MAKKLGWNLLQSSDFILSEPRHRFAVKKNQLLFTQIARAGRNVLPTGQWLEEVKISDLIGIPGMSLGNDRLILPEDWG